jgi:ribonucleotide reductase alpha subunit
MKVVKRDGRCEQISFDKILYRIQALCDGFKHIDPVSISQKVISRIYDGVTTKELDEVAASICYNLQSDDLEYGTLASRIIISNMHKSTSPSFSEAMTLLYQHKESVHGEHKPLISEEIYQITMKYKEKLNSIMKYDRDYLFDYFGFKTIERSYLMRANGVLIERPQHMFMRVSLGIHKEDIKSAIETYEWMSQKAMIHATPTLFHSGTNHPQLLSCFLIGTDDSIEGIFKTMGDCAKISKWAGGIGLHINNIRGKGSRIEGTNGTSNGIVPMLRTYNSIARYINQSGRRPGSIAIYLEPHHPEILEFLDLKKNHGAEEERTRDLFLALWISDLFMERVEQGANWSLMDPRQCPGLETSYGDAYRTLYEQYERDGRFVKQIPARTVWTKIVSSHIETGVPYMLFKDAANRKSNQKNVGTIRSSNLCVAPETMVLTQEYGYRSIESMQNDYVHVWNGEEWSRVQIRKTSDQAELLKLEFSNGERMECTPEHHFYVFNNLNEIEQVSARQLQPGMKLQPFILPALQDQITVDDAAYFRQYDNAMMMELNEHHELRAIECMHTDYQKMYQLRYRLLKYGISCSVVVRQGITYARISRLYDLHRLRSIGLSTWLSNQYALAPLSVKHAHHEIHLTVTHVTKTGRLSPTYCFTEPFKNKGVFNGILTGQCAEILEYSDDQEYACCTLASIGLPYFVKDKATIDWHALEQVVSVLVRNLNKIIDINVYPVPETEKSNKRHRPIGIGVQGFADYLLKLRIPFDSLDARLANIELFESIYYFALKESCQLAKEFGPYETFHGSPASQGILQFDMWNQAPTCDHLDWAGLKKDIQTYGLRNSLLLALMPTATTSQILGYNEAFEPYTSNIYTRRTIAGDFVIMNTHLVRDLTELGIWSKELKDRIIYHNGSVQSIAEIPETLKQLYKTAWEMKQKAILDLAIDRGRYICQTQSMNLFFEDPSMQVLTNTFMYGWKHGLKTGSYYIRTRPKVQATQFTIDPTAMKSADQSSSEVDVSSSSSSSASSISSSQKSSAAFVCSRDNPNCEACSA